MNKSIRSLWHEARNEGMRPIEILLEWHHHLPRSHDLSSTVLCCPALTSTKDGREQSEGLVTGKHHVNYAQRHTKGKEPTLRHLDTSCVGGAQWTRHLRLEGNSDQLPLGVGGKQWGGLIAPRINC